MVVVLFIISLLSERNDRLGSVGLDSWTQMLLANIFQFLILVLSIYTSITIHGQPICCNLFLIFVDFVWQNHTNLNRLKIKR